MQPETSRHPLRPLLLGLAVFLVYLATLTRAHSGDDIQWIMQVESAVMGTSALHPASTALPGAGAVAVDATAPRPRYLLALPTFAGLFAGARQLGWPGQAVGAVQFANALLAAVGVVWFYLALRQVVADRLSVVASLGLASSHAWWYYATHLDYPIAAHALSCMVLYLLFSIIRPNERDGVQRRAFALGAVNALAILYLATRIVLVPVVAITLHASAAPSGATEPRRLRRPATGYLAGLAVSLVVVIGLFALSSIRATGHPPPQLWKKATYAGAVAHGVAPQDLPKALYGFAKSIVVYPAAGSEEPRHLLAASGVFTRAAFLTWYALVAMVAVAPFGLFVLNRQRLLACRVPATALVWWFVLELPFVVYWEPSYIKWLIGLLIPWWGLVGILAASAFADEPTAHRIVVRAVGGMVGVVFGVNLIAGFLPSSRADADPWLRATDILTRLSTPADLFVALEHHPLNFQLPYFGRRRVVSIDLVYLSEGRDEISAARAVRSLIQATAADGARVYVYPCGEPQLRRLQALAAPACSQLEPIRLGGIADSGLTMCRAVGPAP